MGPYAGASNLRTVSDGGAGTDTLVVRAELQVLSKSARVDNVLHGGAGTDSLTADARATVEQVQEPQSGTVTALNMLRGGAGQGFLRATADASGGNASALNYLYGSNSGNDTLSANARATSNYIAAASNYLFGGGGDDTLHGQAEALMGGPEHTATNTLIAGAGNDKLVAEASAESVQGPATATNNLQGDSGDDILIATGRSGGGYGSGTVNNTISAGDGNDEASVSGWAATFQAGGGGEVVNTIDGGKGDDHIAAIAEGFLRTARNDVWGGVGNGKIEATTTIESGTTVSPQSYHFLYGGSGDDNLASIIKLGGYGGMRATAVLQGNEGNDIITASTDADTEVGGVLVVNELYGGDGNDQISSMVTYSVFNEGSVRKVYAFVVSGPSHGGVQARAG